MMSRPLTKISMSLSEDKAKKVQEIVDPLMLTDDQVQAVMDTLYREMWMGLSEDPDQRKATSLQMENTYVRSLLDGTEEGDYLALDLGGTNFRVLLCKMRAGRCQSISKNYNVPTPTLYGPAVHVFDHLADSIHKFLSEEGMLDKILPLGFTFSFPMIQEGLNKGILVTWTKTFACPDGVGEDAVKMLEDALERRGVTNVNVVAVLNDTTGTLLAGSYLDKQCHIGLIMGTGCNAAYVEKVDNVGKWKGDKGDSDQVVIDIEWGAFGDNGSLDFTKTEFDEIIDLHSNHKGSFTFEKLFSGHYIGDLARLVMLKLTQEGLMFDITATHALSKWSVFTARHLSDIEKDSDSNLDNTNMVLKDLGLHSKATDSDMAIMRYICKALTIRATLFISAGIAVLLNHMKMETGKVAIDGSLYKYHPNLHNMMMAKIGQLAPNTKCELILAEDGSGRGAAFVAAVAVRMQGKQ